MLTNRVPTDRLGQQYQRLGFAWLPDGTRRLLRPARPERGPR